MASLFQIRRGQDTSSLEIGELYYNQTSQSLQLGSNSSSIITLAKLNEQNVGNFDITGNLIVSGNTTIVGNLQFGSTSSIDTVTLLSEVSSSMIPYLNNTFDLGFSGSGATDKRWKTAYINSITGSLSGSVNGIDLTPFSYSVDSRLDYLEGPFSTSVDSRMDLLEAAMSGSKRLYVSPDGNDTTGSVPHGTQHNPFKTIKAAVESLNPAIASNIQRTTIFVGSGTYTENNPIAVPPGVAIVGDNLRTVRLNALNATKDFFHCHDGNYFYGLRFLDLKYPAFAFSYPCSTATATISAGGVSGLTMIHSGSGYVNGESVSVIIEGPDAGGTTATATASVSGGALSITMVNTGSGYVAGEKPHISIQAPTSQRPVIGTSPYIQNCSSITGPITTDGTALSLNPASPYYAPLPYNVNDVRNASNAVIGSGVIDEQGAGGGIRIDGNLVSGSSPLESFVADAFTQVNQGGPGHLVINKGYAQFVSCFTTFCTYGFKVANGGFANISNSVIDFGAKGLVSKTYFPQTYNTGSSLQTLTSTVVGAVILQDGAGYTGPTAAVTMSGGGASVQATAEATVNVNGSIDEIVILTPGSGYTSQPTLTIAAPGPGGIQATTVAEKAEISGIPSILFQLQSGSRGVDISSNMILNGTDYLVTNVATGSSTNERYVTVYPAPPSITTGDNVYFHQLSNISTGGLVMEYVGSGVTYNALPKFGGVPNRNREIVEYAPGRVFYSTVDNIGNLKIGDFFAVNQLTGEVTIDANQFNLSGLSAIGPFKRNGVGVGVVLNEVSNNTTLLNAQGITGEDTVPTQYAVKEYIGVISASFDSRIDNLEWTSSNHEGRVDILEASQSAFDAAVVLDSTNVTILGNLTVQGTQTSLNTTEVFVEDLSLTLASGSVSSIAANGAGIQIAGADVTMSWSHVGQRIELNKDFAVTGSISSSTIVGIGNVTLYSTSVNSRLGQLELTGSEFDGRLDSIETYTGSVSTSVGLLQTFSASQYKNDSSSFDSRTDLLETTASYLYTTFSTSVDSRLDALETDSGSQESRIVALELTSQSLNQYTASVSTSVGLLQTFSSSQYNSDSSSFNTRISASTLTFNNTTGQTAIDFTQVGTQVSAIASGLATGSNVRFNSITSSNGLFTSGTITCDTLIANNLVGATLPVLEYETVGTLGNILIKGAASKSIQVVDSITFTGLLQSGSNQYSASGLLMTGSITASNGFSGSINGIGNVSEFSASIISRILSGSVVAGTISSSAQVNIYEVENYANFYDAISGDINARLLTSSLVDLSSSIIPSLTNTFDLGSPTKFWKDLYISTGSIKFVDSGGAIVGTLSNTGNGMVLDGGVVANGNSSFGTSSAAVTSVTGSLKVSGSLTTIGTSTATAFNGAINATNGVVSGSSQITSILPAGVVSGSSQITLSSTTGYGTVINQNLLTTSDVTHNNLTLSGNLIVNGTTTTVNSTTLQIGDNIIELNGNGSANGGLLIKDPTAPNTVSGSLLWDSTGDFWKAGAAGSELKLLRIAGDGVVSGSSQITGIGNAQLTNSSITIGSTAISLGSSATTIAGLVSVTSTGFTGALTGNASTATTLATARAINGVNFDGSAAITVTAAAGTLSGATLASGVTASSLTSVGTLTALTVTGAITANGGIAVTGAITATGNISAYVSSDRRLKNNIVPIENALTKLNKIGGYSFDWTDDYIEKESNGKGEDGYFFRKHDIGVIAQELQEILPEAVAEKTDGYLGVRYEKIIPLLIQSIKELQLEIKELKNSK